MGVGSGLGVGQAARLDGSTGPEQQTPLVVTLAGAQHLPLAVGIKPDPHMQNGPTGIRTRCLHWLLFGPLGTCPLGQHTPVDVTWPARQHALPIGTYPVGQFDVGGVVGG
jgi:hypothetical protein